jgi:hypothetical protein
MSYTYMLTFVAVEVETWCRSYMRRRVGTSSFAIIQFVQNVYFHTLVSKPREIYEYGGTSHAYMTSALQILCKTIFVGTHIMESSKQVANSQTYQYLRGY